MNVFATLRKIFAASEQTENESKLYEKYQTWIVRVGFIFGFVGLIAGGIATASLANDANDPIHPTELVRLPLLGGASGFFLGMSIMCAVAPKEFMTGPIGQKWMRLIGTKNVLVARIACIVFGVLGLAVMAGLGWHTVSLLR